MPYIAPFSKQSIVTLRQIKDIAGNNKPISPGDHNPHKPVCENAINRTLRAIGYDTKKGIYGHGFRATTCNAPVGSGLWAEDAVEHQVNRQKRNTIYVACIYKAEHLGARKTMMQRWPNYLEACRESYVSPYTIGENKFIPQYTNESHTLANYHHLHKRRLYIDFYQPYDERHLFYPKGGQQNHRGIKERLNRLWTAWLWD